MQSATQLAGARPDHTTVWIFGANQRPRGYRGDSTFLEGTAEGISRSNSVQPVFKNKEGFFETPLCLPLDAEQLVSRGKRRRHFFSKRAIINPFTGAETAAVRFFGATRASLPEMAARQREPLVYWEKQGADRMCALHCLNSVLQVSMSSGAEG